MLSFHEWVFYSNLVTFIKQNDLQLSAEIQAETIAFQFLENGTGKSSVWGTYYQIYQEHGDTVIQSPDIALIDQDLIDYWSKRAKDTCHPILKARYSGLVCDFSNKVANQRPPFEMVKICAENLVAIYRSNLTNSAVAGRFRIERALNLAIADNQKALRSEIKELILNNDAAVPVNETKNIWTSSFDLWSTGNQSRSDLKTRGNNAIRSLGDQSRGQSDLPGTTKRKAC